MADQLTDWFPPEVTPKRRGWYERDWGHDSMCMDYDYWDGRQWHYGCGKNRRTAGIAMNNRRWRGLASPVKSGASSRAQRTNNNNED